MSPEFISVTMTLAGGFIMTIKIFALTLLFALPLGLVICFGSMSKFSPLRYLVKFFVWVIRGTPLMLQLITIFYVPGLIGQWAKGAQIDNAFINFLATWTVPDRFFAAMTAFVINYACYFSEIYRGGIQSVPVGQEEAGLVLGMTKSQIFFRVFLLQVIKRIVPPMSNEIITLVKDTSLARIIAIIELTKAGEAFMKSDGITWPLFYTGVYYLLFVGVLTLLFNYIERRLSYFR